MTSKHNMQHKQKQTFFAQTQKNEEVAPSKTCKKQKLQKWSN